MHRRAGAKTAQAGDKLASVVKRSFGETRSRVDGVGLGKNARMFNAIGIAGGQFYLLLVQLLQIGACSNSDAIRKYSFLTNT